MDDLDDKWCKANAGKITTDQESPTTGVEQSPTHSKHDIDNRDGTNSETLDTDNTDNVN